MKKIALILTLILALSQSIAQAANLHALEAPQIFLQATESIKKEKEPESTIEKTYQKLIPLDIKFENGLDPYEQQDNYTCARSPYPLLRTVMTLYCKNETIPAGYYLMTPRKINGRTYMLFKQQGKVLFAIPVFGEQQIDPEKEYPQPNDPYDSAPMGLRSIWKGFGIISGRRTPVPKIPECKVECFSYDDQFYGINVYYKDRMYKTVYKLKIYE